MTFETKMSGVKVTDYNIEPLFESGILTLKQCIELNLKQETMNYILDTFRFYKGTTEENEWFAMIDVDTVYKITVLENYPNYEEELIDHFGKNWLKHYIRFGH